ncbi:DoxX family protein [Paraburkholderia sp. DHOC27]|uniref:DoxX family protein n=1 Tax=Paraburkholderia sp. DHOC27 TaxID=2303330 RepID=UPI000E3BDA92|nr:DoxX family protein [Paraburkholderia sp. DHOC27]RFU47595.1 DoxX family protein [Paraburkholderia sp. DHOC27]
MHRDSTGSAAQWTGRIISAVVVLALLADAVSILMFPPSMQAKFAATGFPDATAPMLGMILLICTIAYATPRTAVVGAILLTGFLGGAICTHFRLGEIGSPPQIISLVLGACVWGALYLRDERVRSLFAANSLTAEARRDLPQTGAF